MPLALDFTPDELAAGEALGLHPWQFLKSAPALEFLPPADRVEIAFAGRSNVGKSTLINALARHKGLARTSNTPGRTQELNFFHPDTHPLYIVDMPGYGFAKAPKEKVDAWTALVRAYLGGRPNLARVFVLIDSRHGAKAIDQEIMKMLDVAAVSFEIVLTKFDKLNHHEQQAVFTATEEIAKTHPAAYPRVIATSSETSLGIDALRAEIACILADRK
jgi:GTP-binding protein